MLVLTTLKWDVSVVISTDFLDHLLLRLQLISGCWSSGSTPSTLSKYQLEAVRRRATDLCLYTSTGDYISFSLIVLNTFTNYKTESNLLFDLQTSAQYKQQFNTVELKRREREE